MLYFGGICIMNNEKSLFIANFNCTFGTDNKPMLEHFENIIFPAFTQESEDGGNRAGDSEYFFENVQLIMTKGEFVLAGLIIKRTTLEVKSRYIKGKGLVRTDEKHPSDPYSYFLINLKNHRMILVKNQKGSPTLANFSSTARHILQNFVRKYNSKVEKDKKLPLVHLHVVAIPFEGKINEELKKVNKIKNVTLRFYPLNGDILNDDTIGDLLDMLDKVGSQSGSLQINTPDDKEKVGEVIEDSKGLVKPTVRVLYKNGTSRTLKDDSFTEEMKITLDEEESFNENINNIAGKVLNKKEFTETSEENKGIYEKFFTPLEKLYNKYLK